MDTIYLDTPGQPDSDYILKCEALDAARDYILSQEIKPVLWQWGYKEKLSNRMTMDWVAFVTNEGGLPTVYFEIYFVDSQTIIIMETGGKTDPYAGKAHFYTLPKAFDMEYFLTFFEEN